MVQLDDFYKDADDPTIVRRGNAVDWESSGSWHLDATISAIETLCRDGAVDVPIYQFNLNRRTGGKTLELNDAKFVAAEGLFAAQILPELASRKLLAAAVVLANPPTLTLIRRLARDFADRRKPPMTILRLGWQRFRTDPSMVRELTAAGATPMSNKAAEAYLRGLITQAC